MKNKYNLRRKTFDSAISDAFADYLFCEGVHAQYYAMGGEFCPSDTPGRNEEQVPNGLWRRLISKHLNKHFYN